MHNNTKIKTHILCPIIANVFVAVLVVVIPPNKSYSSMGSWAASSTGSWETDQPTDQGEDWFLWFGGRLKSGGWDKVQLGKSSNIHVSSYDTANS